MGAGVGCQQQAPSAHMPLHPPEGGRFIMAEAGGSSVVTTAPAWLRAEQPSEAAAGREPSHTMHHREALLHATTHGQSITLHHFIKLLVYLFIFLLRLGGQGKHLVHLGALTFPVLLVQRLGGGAGGGRQRDYE